MVDRRTGAAWLAAMLAEHRLLGLPDTPATRELPRFQRDAAVRLLDLLDLLGGAVLADEVGLGKTHVAAAVLASRPAWRPALVLAPAAVLPEWARVIGAMSGVETMSYSLLARRGAISFQPALVVADEAHRLRNDDTRTYSSVARLAAASRLLLVSATPLHNSRRDVANLLALLTADPVDPEQRTDTLQTLLSRFLVRRTRWTVEHVYPDADRALEMRVLSFPQRRDRTVATELHPRLAELVPEVGALARTALPDHAGGEVAGLLSALLLQRLESSPAALLGTLRRLRNYLERAREAAAAGRRLARGAFRRLFGTSPEGQVAQLVLPFLFEGPEAPLPSTELGAAIDAIDAQLCRLDGVDWSADPKSRALSELLAEPVRTLVMTGYEETARYLYRGARPGTALLTGAGAWGKPGGRLDARLLVRAFGAAPRGAASAVAERYEVLVSTDVLAEGVNVQGAARLIHYDRSWNPMAVEQRAGRIDRLFSPHNDVEVVTFAVSRRVDERLRFEHRLAHKRDVSRETLGNDPIGLDRDGFLLALAARTAVTVDVSTPGPPVWIVALASGRFVDFARITETPSGPAADWAGAELLGLPATAGCEPLPADVRCAALALAEARVIGERWADLEPRGPARSRAAQREAAAPALAAAAAAFTVGSRTRLAAVQRKLDELARRRAAAARFGATGSINRAPTGDSTEVRVLGWIRLS